MADNMIELIATLNVDDSANQINSVLDQVANKLNDIQINCSLSEASISQIQEQLNGLTIDIAGLNISNIDVSRTVNDIQNNLSTTAKLDLSMNTEEIEKFIDEITKLNVYGVNIEELQKRFQSLNIAIETITPTFTQLGEDGQRVLSSLAIKGKDSFGNLVNYVETYNAKTGEFVKSTTKATENLGKIEKAQVKIQKETENAQKSMNEYLTLEGKFNVWSKQYSEIDDIKVQLNDMAVLFKEFDNTAPLDKQRESLIKIDYALKLIEVDIKKLNQASVKTGGTSDFYPSIAKSGSTSEILESAKTTLNETFASSSDTISDKASRVKRAIEDTSGELQRFYVQVERGDKSVETLTYAINEQGTAYEYLGKTIREADNSTDFRRKDLGTQWSIQAEKLIQFANNADKAGFASKELSDDIKSLFAELNKANPQNGGDTLSMNAFLDNFDIAKAKLQALNAEARKNTFADNLQNKVKKLSADMQAYAVANDRAVESQKKMSNGQTFAQEWVRLTSEMAKGAELTDAEIKKLTAEFRIFGKEAKAVGLEGESAIGKFLNSFKTISTYVSASRLITLITSQIRSAITELQTLDDRLTEIKKTSDRTDESIKRLGESSFQAASEFGRTASDYLLGVQEMSRAGFSETQSEQLARLSILAQAAGDMTAEMANQYLIATNAAYKLEGNEEKLNQILDSQNYITNHNAVNMEHLSQATKLAASQAASSGVAIDELTAAVGTMVATTQQGGDQAGRAFKGILMNIQQVKASASDIGDGGADITAESLSKYEKASAALGVSLKEVRNGTIQLREPMEVLRDLAVAVSKESENSIKVANLVSAVGGKFRGNQLIALLQNWDVYEKMLSEFNSEEAIGSAMDEAIKSANNWAGSINKVKNSWAELVSQFANSETMISILNSVNDIIKSMTNSAATGALRLLSSGIADIVKVLSLLINKIGVIPTLVTGKALTSSLRASFKSLQVEAAKANTSLVTYIGSLDKARLATMAFGAARNALVSFGISYGVELLVKGISNLAYAEERAAEAEKERREEFEQNLSTYNQEQDAITSLIERYTELAVNSENSLDAKKDLSSMQSEIINKYNLEADAIDLVNGKYSEQIEKLYELKRSKAEEFVYDPKNIKEYKEALDNLNNAGDINGLIDVEFKDFGKNSIDAISEDILDAWKQSGSIKEYQRMVGFGNQLSHGFKLANDDALSIYQTLEEMAESYKTLSTTAGNFNQEQYSAIKAQAVAAKETYESWQEVVDVYENNLEIAESEIPTRIREQYDSLLEQAKKYYEVINGEGSTEQKFLASEELKKVKEQIFELINGDKELTEITNNLFSTLDNGVHSALGSVDDLNEAFLATLDDMQKGSLKHISTMVSALQDLSEGKGIAANTFWSLIEFDTEGLLNGAKLVGDKFYITQENMIKLKDQYIQKQIDSIKLLQVENEKQKRVYEDNVRLIQMQINTWSFAEKPLTNPIYRKEYDELNLQLEEAKQGAKAFGDAWVRNNWLVEYLNQTLGDTVDKQKELEAQQKALNKEITALNKELDNYVKAHETVIDNIIKGIELEQHELEEQKKVLQDELDILNKQKDTIEETIKNYDTVNKLVQDTLNKRKEGLEAEKKSIEDSYNERINKLKEENEQREDALEYAQKLAALENARNNKRRVYDETRGWRYESVKDDVVKAENDLKSYENSQAIKKLEKERDALTKSVDEQIKSETEYAELWKDINDVVQTEEGELLAEQILGADWREKIAAHDTEVMEKFRSEYLNHNIALNNLTKSEIKLKQASIDAKDAEIDAKKQEGQAWKDYKTTVTTAVNEIKTANEGYMSQIGAIELSETSSLEDRERAYNTFKEKVAGYIDDISNKQTELDRLKELQDEMGGEINYDVHVNGLDELKQAAAAATVIATTAGMTGVGGAMMGVGGVMAIANSPIFQTADDIADTVKDILNRIGLYSSGGVADYTGLAMLHGRKNAPEVIFNASDSAKLYQLVHGTPNLMADMIDKATKLSQFNMAKVGNTTNTSSVNIDSINVYANNPAELSRGLDKELDRYFQTKLTQNYTSRS